MNEPNRKAHLDLRPAVAPSQIIDRVKRFLLDGSTGNVTLNVRDGEILGLHLEEIIKANAARPVR